MCSAAAVSTALLNALIPAIPPGLTLSAMLLITADSLVTIRYLLLTGDVTFTVPLR